MSHVPTDSPTPSGIETTLVTRRALLDPDVPGIRRIGDLLKRAPIVVHEHHSLREAADRMVEQNVGCARVVASDDPERLIGIRTRGDLLAAHAPRLRETHWAGRHIRVRQQFQKRFGGGSAA